MKCIYFHDCFLEAAIISNKCFQVSVAAYITQYTIHVKKMKYVMYGKQTKKIKKVRRDWDWEWNNFDWNLFLLSFKSSSSAFAFHFFFQRLLTSLKIISFFRDHFFKYLLLLFIIIFMVTGKKTWISTLFTFNPNASFNIGLHDFDLLLNCTEHSLTYCLVYWTWLYLTLKWNWYHLVILLILYFIKLVLNQSQHATPFNTFQFDFADGKYFFKLSYSCSLEARSKNIFLTK